MKTTGSQKAKIGMFTLIGLVLLVIGIFIIGNKKNMFGDTFNIHGTFRNVGGLQIGNNIRFAGINVGTVESIEMLNDTTVRVNMRLQSKVHKFLKNDAMASIGSDGLMGDKLVTIAPGLIGDKTIENNGQILTTNPMDFDKIFTRVNHITENAEVITASLASIASEISSGRGNLGRLIYTDDLQKSLIGTVNAAKQTMSSAQQGVAGFSENMEALKHNFLLKGYYKKKAKEEKEAKDKKDHPAGSTDATEAPPTKTRKERRKEAREEKKAKKQEAKQAKEEAK
jgi:phospholipid/cholesterol/gamma-HCH transport system substrate-binding protein